MPGDDPLPDSDHPLPPGEPLSDGDRPAKPSGAPVALPPPRVDLPPVLAALDAATKAQERWAALAAVEGRTLAGPDLVTLLRRLPDGWQRRTAARRLLTAGGLGDVDPDAVLASFARHRDRSAVARLLVAAGLATPEAVLRRLGPHVAARWRRRLGRTS